MQKIDLESTRIKMVGRFSSKDSSEIGSKGCAEDITIVINVGVGLASNSLRNGAVTKQ